MNKHELYPITPHPFKIQTADILGLLYIEGSMEENLLEIRFRFVRYSPCFLQVSIEVNNSKIFECRCTSLDFERKSVSSGVFHPSFSISLPLKIVSVTPLVTCEVNQ